MTKVMFCFAGTGDDGYGYASMKEKHTEFNQDVIRIYIKGCHNARVGNGFLFPDLEIAANNVRNSFTGNILNLKKLQEHFGEGLYGIKGSTDDTITVDEIILDGFSRGAVTTFATAKKLDSLNIPIHIIANQPVPGEAGIIKPLYYKYCDLSTCKNIHSAYTFLSSYDLENGFVHNSFFRQMVAKFAPEAQAKNILFPHKSHLSWFSDSPIHYHINKLLAERGIIKSNDEDKKIADWYSNNIDNFFTPYEFMQIIYGADGLIDKDPFFHKHLIKKASTLLMSLDIKNDLNIDSNQAAAITSIDHLSDEHIAPAMKIDLYYFIIKNTPRSKQFVNIINKISEVCDYLPHATYDISDEQNKSQKIISHANFYKKSIFLDSYDFLNKDNPSYTEKKDFAASIYKAEVGFRNQALSIDRSVMRRILKFLTNFITHITGVALIVNTINKVQTGNWLLFSHNRSENAVRNTRQQLLSDIKHLDADNENTSSKVELDETNKPEFK
ncbi:MAG: hypothetical protein PSV35_09125 [bacterium]|nr:hypothetical protein [bacterium]